MKWLRTASVAVTLLASLPALRVATAPTADERAIVHVLNRVTFGPRAADVETIRRIGLDKYIDQQLRPDRIPDLAMGSRLSALSTLSMGSKDLAAQYERPLLESRRARQREMSSSPNAPARPAVSEMTRREANVPLLELAQAKVLRAAYSDRQLQEVLTDFWFNHFNVDARKGPSRFLLTAYERDAIRPHVLGRFRDLLGATARSPAMLFYLDNWMSADPNGPHLDRPTDRRPGLGQGRVPQPGRVRLPARPDSKRPTGLNENYGRELLELHTLGVDGGYTQKDVTEVARAFTGWTIAQPRMGGDFRFEPRLHDPGEKMVLGHRIKAGGGMKDGEEVLDLLARHPSTARFIATKLTRRFVSDAPPPALVDRAASTFRETDGDLGSVMRVILTSPEFRSPEMYRSKVKTPFEFLVSAVRASGAVLDDGKGLVHAAQQLGMPLYQCQPPTGYKDTSDAWVNTGALVNRMNVALALADGTLEGVRRDTGSGIGGGLQIPESLIGDLSEATKATIAKAVTPEQVAALTLGSPEFQRR